MSTNKHASLSLADPHPAGTPLVQKIGLGLVGISIVALIAAVAGSADTHPLAFLLSFFISLATGTGLYIYGEYKDRAGSGINNNGVMFRNISSRGLLAWVLGVTFTTFYVCLYFYPAALEGIIRMFDPLSQLMRGKPADQWFTYGAFYTIAILFMGAKFLVKYRHSKYHLIRTCSVMFFQLGLAFLLPYILAGLNQPEYYFTYFWPLDQYKLFPNKWESLNASTIGIIFFAISFGLTFIATPILTYFYGKRWFCSWVCGCGGLAETAGDPFRHLSSKTLLSWKVERWLIHGVLLLITLGTGLLWLNWYLEGQVLQGLSQQFSSLYGFFISSMFAGVIGTGFYPILGNRVWCRFGCPMAAILGIIQRFKSRFRITTNGDQCISCGNCSTYCEQGIDVRWYAQRGQNIVRASCVGCGICAAVCPRGVLRLENGPDDNETRTGVQAIHISRDEVNILRPEESEN